MKILHVVASYLPAVRYGGTIVSVHGLCKSLAARGHEVHVFTTSVDGPRDSDVVHGVPVAKDGVKVWYFRSQYLRRLYWSPPLGAALDAQVATFDVAHTHAIFLWPLWAAARAARRAGVPYVVSPRGMLEKGLVRRKSRFLKTAWIRTVERRNLECAAAIHVTSPREAAEAASFGFNLPRILTVPNGVEIERDAGAVTPRIRQLIDEGPYVLFLGRLSWKKGLDRLVQAIPHTSAELRFVIAGNDEEGLRATLQAEVDQLRVSHRVTFAGAVAGADKQALLSHARLTVLPSYSENFGNVVVEAMAAGCPVIVTPEVGIAPMVEQARAGWVVEGDPATLGRRIAELAGDERLRREMGECGRRAAVEHFTWDAVATRLESAYEDLIRRRRAT